MMKIQQSEHRLLWLLRPEDSSSWEGEATRSSSENKSLKGIFLPIAKFLLCYTVAVAVTVFLSGLH